MADDTQLKLTFRLVPADDRPAVPVVLDDIVRLINQAIATDAKDAPRVADPDDGFREPGPEERRGLRGLESRIENRIQESSAAAQATVEQRAQTASQPDGDQKLADEALAAAERIIAAVHRALLSKVAVRVPPAETDIPLERQ